MTVVLSAIREPDLSDVGQFLHEHLNRRVSAQAWTNSTRVPWAVNAPNHGFLLRDGNSVVGAYLAFYSTRVIGGEQHAFCNLGAWCVAVAYRNHSVKLIRALLAQDGFTFTDLSPSGSVVPLNIRLGFTALDTTTALVPALPWLSRPGGITITTERHVIEAALDGDDLSLYRDHHATAATRHVLIRRGTERCYVILRRDRRRNLPVFASLLHVSNPELFRVAARHFSRHLLLRHRVLALLVELRVTGRPPTWSLRLARSRPKMFKSATVTADRIDYLYSELACVAW